ncbi:ZIP family metal transporter [Jannaschia formosa]|uniref:ZIP family metal transporter n=1 Tax=Jannaschia formosa TaxID=2259592 RepID=UPI000E1BF4C4|nr:divalent cation transporter [Jannaschia formosa]TFL19908.1 divalent cation transporter [Jannaschia formosa]
MPIEAMLWSLLAGAAIPFGGWLAMYEHVRPQWLETEIRHAIIAFAGGALISAVTLVLVPQGTERLPPALAVAAFVAGGAGFALLDRWIDTHLGRKGQLVALLSDYIPEAVALGALFASGERMRGILTAAILTLQNLPEAFNAWREMVSSGQTQARQAMAIFAAFALLGPVAALVGQVWLAEREALLGAILLFAAGGIFYLVFEDIAPGVRLDRAWAPPLGAVAGYGLGLTGHLLLPA